MAINKRKILQSAQKHVQKGAFDKALEDYKTLLKADPKDSNIRLKVGDLYLKMGKSDDAVASYLKVAERFVTEGFDAKAVALYKQVTKLDPKRLDVHGPLAEVYQRMGLTQDAMKALQTAADAAYKAGDKIEALHLLRKMGSLDPGNTTNRMKVADLLQQEEQHGEAIDEYLAIAEELDRQGLSEERLRVLGRVLEIEPERRETLLEVGRLYLVAERWADAEAAGRTVTAAHPDELDGHDLLGRALEGGGKEEECARVFHHLADVYRERGDDDRARDLAQRYGAGAQLSVDDSAPPVLETDDSLAIGGELPDDELGDDRQFTDPGFSQEGLSLGEPIETLHEDGEGTEPPTDDLAANPAFDEELAFDDMEVDPTPTPSPAGADGTVLDELPLDPIEPDEGPPPAVDGAEESLGSDGPSSEDPEALLAEANVYLRYGKHERAIESLRAVVSRAPAHVAALEKLGEALAASGDTANAVTAFERAAGALRDAGHADGIERLRAKLEEIDAEAAARLPGAPDGGEAHGEAEDGADGFEIEIDDGLDDEALQEPGAQVRAESPAEDDDEDFEIDLDAEADAPDPAAGEAAEEVAGDGGSFEIELDLEAEETSETTDTTDSTDPTDTTDGASDLGLDAAADELDDEEELVFGEGGPPGVSAPDEVGDEDELVFEDTDQAGSAAAPAAGDDEEISGLAFVDDAHGPESEDTDPLAAGSQGEETDPPTSGSSTTPAQIVEDLEEAEFYFSQGMLAEARAVYERILSLAPGHAKAMLRLGEIEASGGGKPGATEDAPDTADATDPVDAPTPELEGADSDAVDDTGGFAFGEEAGAPDPAASEPSDSEPGPASEPAPEDPDAASFDPQSLLEDEPSEDLSLPADGESFDLAAELSDALGDSVGEGGGSGQGLAGTTEEEGFEQVFAAFKQGVESALDADGDQQAHYDLGIAYKEMGLLDDAIGEFQQAMSASEHRLASLHMMALCALDLGRPADAVAHLEQGLSEGEIPEEHQIGLRFDLGRAHAKGGDLERARACFEAVQAIDPQFCDVEQVLAELSAAPDAALDAAPDAAGEAFESFDDLIGGDDDEDDDADEEPAEAPAEPAYESFDDLMGDDDDAAAEPVAAEPVAAEPVAAEPVAEAAVVEEAVEAEPTEEPVLADEPEPDPEPDPEPEDKGGKPKRRRKKISFV